jgi:hypothetical protein
MSGPDIQESGENSPDETGTISEDLKIAISALAMFFIILHIIFPQRVDTVVIALLLILISPWILPYVKSIPTPFGPIEPREVKKAEKKVETVKISKPEVEARMKDPSRVSLRSQFEDILREDPRLALASLRIKFAESLKKLASEKNLIMPRKPVSTTLLLNTLYKSGVIDRNAYDSFTMINNISNKAVYGARVDYDTAERIIEISDPLLEYLNIQREYRPLRTKYPAYREDNIEGKFKRATLGECIKFTTDKLKKVIEQTGINSLGICTSDYYEECFSRLIKGEFRAILFTQIYPVPSVSENAFNAMKNLDLIVVLGDFPSELSNLAHVVIPRSQEKDFWIGISKKLMETTHS